MIKPRSIKLFKKKKNLLFVSIAVLLPARSDKTGFWTARQMQLFSGVRNTVVVSE